MTAFRKQDGRVVPAGGGRGVAWGVPPSIAKRACPRQSIRTLRRWRFCGLRWSRLENGEIRWTQPGGRVGAKTAKELAATSADACEFCAFGGAVCGRVAGVAPSPPEYDYR